MREVLHNFSVFLDGVGEIGKAKTITPPKLVLKVEEWLGGGMSTAVEIPLGQEKMEAEVVFNSIHRQSFQLFALQPGNIKPLTCHGAIASQDGTKVSTTIHMRGFIKEIDEDAWQAQKLTEHKISFAVHHYRRLENGQPVLEIAPEVGKIIVNGIEQTAWIRDALYF